MANFLRSPGFFAREIEVFPVATPPQPGGAGAVGTAEMGPAFVPVTVGSVDALSSVFGNVHSEHQGIFAGREFLRQGGPSFTYIRVLGAGTAPRIVFTGDDSYLSHTPNAGFVAGQPQFTTASIDDSYIVETVNQFSSSQSDDVFFSALNDNSSVYFLGGYYTDSPLATALTATNLTNPQVNNIPALLTSAGANNQQNGFSTQFVTSSLYTFSGAGAVVIGYGTTIGEAIVVASSNDPDVTGTVGGIGTTTFELTSSGASTFRWSAFTASSAPAVDSTQYTGSHVARAAIFTYGSGAIPPVMPYRAAISSSNGYGAFGEMYDANGAPLSTAAEVEAAYTNANFRFAIINSPAKNAAGFYAPTSDEFVFGPVICSMNPNQSNYFANILNKDPAQFVDKGHLLYGNFDVLDSQIHLTGSLSGTIDTIASGTINTGMINGQSGTLGGKFPMFTPFFCVPPQGGSNRKWHNFVDRFKRPASPMIFSQPLGNTEYDLFRAIAKHDGVGANSRFKVAITNLRFPTTDLEEYPTFAVEIRQFSDTDRAPVILEKFTNLNLNPNSERFVAKIIGDANITLELDTTEERDRKLITNGEFAAKSNYIYAEVTQELLDGRIPRQAVPFGYGGIEVPDLTTVDVNTTPFNTITSGSTLVPVGPVSITGENIFIQSLSGTISGTIDGGYRGRFTNSGGSITAMSDFWLPVTASSGPFSGSTMGDSEVTPFQVFGEFFGVELSGTFTIAKCFDMAGLQSPIVPPIPYRLSMTRGSVSNRRSVRRDLGLYWGFQTTEVDFTSPKTTQDPNASQNPNRGITSNLLFYGVPETNNLFTGTAADTHSFNKFTLANVELGATTANTEAAMAQLNIADVMEFRYKRAGVASATASFADLAAIGGIDGARYWNRLAGATKFVFPVRGGFDGVNLQARDAGMLNAAAVSNSAQTGSIGESNEVFSYNEAVRVMLDPDNTDIELFAVPSIYEPLVTDQTMNTVEDTENALYILDLDQVQSDTVNDVIDIFEARGLDSTWTATYFPNVRVPDPNSGNLFSVSPSAVVLGAVALNDRVGQPWFAPAGISRGALSNVESQTFRLRANDRDNLYDANINPIISVPNEGFKVWGQKTLSQDPDSSLNRLSVRRLMIRVRRLAREIGRGILFDQYNQAAVDQTRLLLTQSMANIQKLSGISGFKVELSPDFNSNTLTGKITLIPTRTIEFVVIDFIVDASGVTFT